MPERIKFLSPGSESISRHQVSKWRVREQMLSRSGSGQNKFEHDAEIAFEEVESAAAVGKLTGQLEDDFFPGED